MNEFNELVWKMRCKFAFKNTGNDSKIHPFNAKSGYDPVRSCHTLENYIRLELFYLPIRQKYVGSISARERKS